MRTTGAQQETAAKKSRTGRRVGIVLATVGLSFTAFAPMAHAFGGDHDGHGDHGHHGLWLPIGDPSPSAPQNHNCGEDGMETLDLDPLASAVVHYGVEPIVGGIDNSLGAPDNQGLEGAVHAINCTTVVPLEDGLDDMAIPATSWVESRGYELYGFARFICDHEFVCDHAVYLP